ncbi:hypothetical protein [Clostridium frigidicarnis]|uniref:Uncharacterized protein n=1 Tax=Clostridium frigidicarnis TaxID=84698 RepID=A0A1I0X9K3_9CLOT|nr:hypothetical protein [Clostridium frigidicarnis]SFA97357.1 hypothetical protein SAMN04488528_1007154 [Clostridium frigidicarnis]
MDNYTTSQQDIGIIVAWMLGLVFIIAMISAERSKYKSIIRAFLSITVVYVACVCILRFDVFEYIYAFFIVAFSTFILIGDILNFYTYKINSRIKNKSIQLSSTRFIGLIIITLIIFMQICDKTQYRFVDGILPATMLINLPLDYLMNYHINIYENGILLQCNSFLKRLVYKKEIISYKIIENITFSEYERGKFNLKIDIKENNKKHSYNYEIKKKDKESMISFISSFIDKEKIRVLREYDLNNTLVK